MNPSGHGLGHARRRSHHGRQKAQQLRIGLQQREQLDAGGKLGEEAVEAAQGGIGIVGGGQGRNQHRMQLGQTFSRLRRPGGGVAAEVPGLDDIGRVIGLFEPEA